MTNTNDTKLTLVYETSTCGRCGGSGHYSYNMINGTVCFGCKGRKVRNTKAGAAARAAVDAFIAENFSVLVADLKVGDVIKYDGYVRTVASLEDGGTGSNTVTENGVKTVTEYKFVTINFNKPVPSQFGNVGGAGMPTTGKVQKAVMGADWNRVIEFARTIKKGVTVVAKATA